MGGVPQTWDERRKQGEEVVTSPVHCLHQSTLPGGCLYPPTGVLYTSAQFISGLSIPAHLTQGLSTPLPLIWGLSIPVYLTWGLSTSSGLDMQLAMQPSQALPPANPLPAGPGESAMKSRGWEPLSGSRRMFELLAAWCLFSPSLPRACPKHFWHRVGIFPQDRIGWWS